MKSIFITCYNTYYAYTLSSDKKYLFFNLDPQHHEPLSLNKKYKFCEIYSELIVDIKF